MQKFSDFAEEDHKLEGAKEKLDNILNKEIVITGCRITKSKYSKNESGNYLTIQYKMSEDDEPKIIFTGSEVLIKQCEKYQNEIPFISVIKKIGNYYTLT